jgi:hypothetical protein
VRKGKYDIELDFEYADSDKIEIEIPGGYKPESIPPDVIVESKFGKIPICGEV